MDISIYYVLCAVSLGFGFIGLKMVRMLPMLLGLALGLGTVGQATELTNTFIDTTGTPQTYSYDTYPTILIITFIIILNIVFMMMKHKRL